MSKNNKKIISNDKNKLNDTPPLETIKSKYVLANTIKANKISSKLSKSVNNVVSDKNFVGFNEDDYQHVEKMCELNNVNLFVKHKSQFFDNISCEKNLHIKCQQFIGYTEAEYNNLNNDTTLHIKGDTEMNGNLFVYQHINCEKQINAEQCINIGFENELPDNTSRLNVNGNSEFVGDNIIYGSEYIKNNLIVNDKANFFNDIFMSNSIYLKKEIMNNVSIVDNTISSNNYKVLLNNMLLSIKNHNQSESSVLKFYSKKNSNLYSGLISASKKFIIDNNTELSTSIDANDNSDKKILAFILVHGIYSNSKIISVKPVIDTFVLVDSKENIITIGNIAQCFPIVKENEQTLNQTLNQITNTDSEYNNSQTKHYELTENITASNNLPENNLPENTSFFTSSVDLLKNNKFVNFIKTSDTQNSDNSDNSDTSSFISNKSDKSEKNNLNDFTTTSNKNNYLKVNNLTHFENSGNAENDIINKTDSIDVFEMNISTTEKTILNNPNQSKSIKEEKDLSPNNNLEQSTKYEKKKKVHFNFDSDLDLDAFEII